MFVLNSVKYKNILDIKDLTIEKNKITCILGESGSGKTTLLRLLNKLISCDSGEILYNKKSLREIDSIELRRQVVMLGQTPVIFSGDIKVNLLLGLQYSEKPMVSDDMLLDILARIHLKKNLTDNAEKLSGGEKQRLALGRVILMNPDVFLLDEPSSALDEDTALLILEKMVEHVKQMDKTLIMVTHSKRIAEEFADNIIIITQGKIRGDEV